MSNPPAGWYPDPQDANRQRYWDGNAWTEHTADATPQAAAGGTPTTGGGAPLGQGLGASAPDPWLWQSIVATLLCCLPAGVVGIIYAVKSQKAAGEGDLRAATEAAKTAKTWTLVSVGIGVVVGIIAIGFTFLGAAAGVAGY